MERGHQSSSDETDARRELTDRQKIEKLDTLLGVGGVSTRFAIEVTPIVNEIFPRLRLPRFLHRKQVK